MSRRESVPQRIVRAQIEARGQVTVFEACLVRAGLGRGPHVFMTLYWWVIVCRRWPDHPVAERVAEVASCSRANAFRRLQELRDCFDPDELDQAVKVVQSVLDSSGGGTSAGLVLAGAALLPGFVP